MATILDKLTPGAELGERLGQGVASGLQSLVDAKLGQLHKQAGLMNSMSPQQAKMLSMLPDNLYGLIVPQLIKENVIDKKADRLSQEDENNKISTDNKTSVNDNANNSGLKQFIDPSSMVQPMYGQGANGPQTNAEIVKQALNLQQPLNALIQPQSSIYEQQMALQPNIPEQQNLNQSSQGVNINKETIPLPGIVNGDFDYNKEYARNLRLYRNEEDARDATRDARKAYLSDRKFMQQQAAKNMTYQQKRYDNKWDNFEKDLNNEAMIARKNEERMAGYKNALSFLETGKAGVGFEAWAKEYLGVENITDNSITQALRKVLAREPLEFLVTLAKEGGATAARSKAVFEQVQKATGKTTNTVEGLRDILKINKATLKLQNEYSKIKSEIAQRYKRDGKEPDYLIEQEVNKRMKPSLKKFQNLGNEIVLNSRASNWSKEEANKYLSKNKLGSNIYFPNIDKTFKLGKKNGRIDYKYIGKGRVK